MLSIVRLFDLASKAPPLDKGFVIVTCILGVIYGIIAMTIIKKCHKPESKKAIAVIAVLMLKPVNDCILYSVQYRTEENKSQQRFSAPI